MSDSLARRERVALCDLALELGPDAPTLCEGWTCRDLLAHLVVREHSPIAATGIVVPQLAGLTEREMARAARRDFGQLVEKVRTPRWTPTAIAAVDKLFNTVEFFVHHEDLRRAQPGWEPRDLPDVVQSALWRSLGTIGKGLVRKVGVPVTVRRADTGETHVLVRGVDPVVVTGEPAELLLFLFGRTEVRGLEFTGPDDACARLRSARLGA